MTSKKIKILFWLENYTIHFGIAKFLKEQFDCELYAVISCSSMQKDFFENQKLIEFEKVWYIRENISINNEEPNIEYLKLFEEKMNIPISSLIFGDRFFYKYNRYDTFTRNEILTILEQELKFFEKIIDEVKPTCTILRVPEFQDIELFYEVCRTKNIPTLILDATRFGARYMINNQTEYPIPFDNTENLKNLKNFKQLREHIDSYSKSYAVVMKNLRSSKTSKVKAVIKFLFQFKKIDTQYYHDRKKSPLNVILKEFIFTIKKLYRYAFIERTLKKSTSFETPYAYFPLQFEPERTILRKGEFYSNQLSVIKNIAQSLPVDMKLFVKEHPAMQLNGWHNLEFYKEILKMSNVELFHPSCSNSLFVKNCSLVITIAGTSGLEAIFYGKPSILFTTVNYSDLSSVFHISTFENLPNIIKNALESKVDLVELNNYVQKVEKISFDCDVVELIASAEDFFGSGGFLDNLSISEKDMIYFLNKHKELFSKLALEHIKKIGMIKK
jgi:hypothetical protein